MNIVMARLIYFTSPVEAYRYCFNMMILVPTYKRIHLSGWAKGG